MDSQQNAYNFTKKMNAWSSTIHSKYSDQVNFKYKFIFRYWTLLLSEKKRRQKFLRQIWRSCHKKIRQSLNNFVKSWRKKPDKNHIFWAILR